MKTFQKDELVDITIRAARVEAFNAGYMTFAPKSGAHITIETGSVGVDIARVAPAEWPPQPGDVWADARGDEWFARTHPEIEGIALAHQNAERTSDWDAGTILDAHGPMRLVYRRGWTPAAPAAEPTPEQLDERAEVIAGLREMADWAEANPDIPLDTHYTEMLLSISRPTEEADRAELLRIAELVGEPPNLTATHPGVRKVFRGRVSYRAYYIPAAKPAADVTPGVGEVAGPAEGSGPATAIAMTAAGELDIAPADGTSSAGAPFTGDVSAAVPVSAPSGGGAAVALPWETPGPLDLRPQSDPALSALASVPGAAVWTASIRRGLVYHKAGELETACGRSQVRGELISPSEAVELNGTSCSRCYPEEG